MGHGLDLGTLNAYVRCPGTDDRSSGTQVWSRCVNCAPLSSIFALVIVGVDSCRFVDRTFLIESTRESGKSDERTQCFCMAMRASVTRMRVAASTEPRTVPAIFD